MFAASKSGSAAAKDPQFNYVTMLLHGNGTNGAQNNTFVDSSTNNFTITRNGNTTQGTFTPYGSNWSNYFDGSGDYLTAGSSISLSGDFTVEGWVYPTTSSGNGYYLLGLGNDYFSTGATFFITTSGYLRIYTGNANILSGTSGVVQLNTWNHIAFVRSGTTVKAYLNGTQVDSATFVSVLSGTAYINAELNGNPTATVYAGSAGYYSNVRIGTTAVYTTAFTPSTTPLTAITGTQLLTCQSNRFIDNSTNAYTITRNGDVSVQRFSPFSPTTAYSTSVIGGSGYFDGSGDWLRASGSTAFDMGNGDFTIEAWVYPQGSGNRRFVDYANGTASNSNFSFVLRETSSNTIYGSVCVGATEYAITSTETFSNTWVHVALVRNGTGANNLKLYVNGVSVGTPQSISTSSINTLTGTPYLSISSYYNGAGEIFNGYVNDVRIVKGTALYTSTFTPSTTPLTAVSGTSLLLSTTNAGILDNAMMNDLETVGNAQISTSVKKYGSGSLKFNGTTDYLTRPSSDIFNFGTGDFTVEFWVYFNAVSSVQTLVSQYQNSTTGWGLQWRSDTSLWNFFNGDTQLVTYSNTPSTSTWIHVAVARSGTSLKMFINGTQVGSVTNSTSLSGSTNPLTVGALNATGISAGIIQYFNGYIDDLRITKGVARYTANFTAPTATFADKG